MDMAIFRVGKQCLWCVAQAGRGLKHQAGVKFTDFFVLGMPTACGATCLSDCNATPSLAHMWVSQQFSKNVEPVGIPIARTPLEVVEA